MEDTALLQLPTEILGQIIDQVARNDRLIYKTLATLRACRRTCHIFNDLVTPYLYRHIPLNGPHSFAKFLDELRVYPARGKLVRTLDFSAFTSIGLGRSRSCNTRILLLTATTLNECLCLCPNVEEVFLSEALESDIDAQVLRTIFVDLKHIKAVDFCASDSTEFVHAFASFTVENQIWHSNIANLSLHNCSTLSSSFFESFLPHFRNLKRLDLYNTQVTGLALRRIPETCQLNVLNLSQCTRIDATDLLTLMTSHKSTQSLKTLCLLYSWNKVHPLNNVPQLLDTFLQSLPRALEVLDLAGVEMDLEHIGHMPLTLRELGVHDIDVSTPPPPPGPDRGRDTDDTVEYRPILPNLKYLLLTHHIISSEVKYAGILTDSFPSLSIIESPGFAHLPLIKSEFYKKLPGPGRRDWLSRTGFSAQDVESSGNQWHPRKSNMSLNNALPRGIYDYYSYRV